MATDASARWRAPAELQVTFSDISAPASNSSLPCDCHTFESLVTFHNFAPAKGDSLAGAAGDENS